MTLAFAPAVHAATYYLSPTGSDSAAGTQSAPWKTFGKAFGSVRPGDAIALLDGTYTADASGLARFDCTNGHNGTPTAPITLKAINPRKAFVQGSGTSEVLMLSHCSWWVIDGLRVENIDNSSNTRSNASAAKLYASNNVTLRNSIIRHPNRYGNNDGITVFGSSTYLTIEDNEVLFFHRNGIAGSCDLCNHIAVRRNYVNPQGAQGPPPFFQGPNDGIVPYWWDDSIFENNIVEGAVNGFANFGVRNRFLGNVSTGNGNGFADSHGYNETSPTAHSDQAIWQNDAAIANRQAGMTQRSALNSTVENLTVWGGANSGFIADNGYDVRRGGRGCNGHGCTLQETPGITLRNSLVVNANGGYAVANASEFATRAFSFSYGWANSKGTWRAGTELRDAATTPPDSPGDVDPQLGSCRVFIPDTSPMKRKGKDGADVGANVLYRYQDGVLTTTPLWDPTTGEFPHGAVIAGVNDVAGQNVFDVHKRLNVNANGCQLPSWYGSAPSPTPTWTPTFRPTSTSTAIPTQTSQ
jgi:Right handed beta helix region/Protein of unknown function (DUF1565)